MLGIWRRRLGYDDVRTDCSVESYDGHDVNGRIREAMRAWYLHLLDTADPRLLPHGPVAAESTQTAGPRRLLIRLPDRCRRPLRMTAARWDAPAEADPDPRRLDALRRLASPFGWPDDSCPAMCLLPGGDIVAAPLDEGDAFTVVAVTDPADGSYVLDESLLDTIPHRLIDNCHE